MDEGTAWIIGIMLLVLWIVLVMFPNVVFIKKHTKYLSIIIVIVVLLCLLCILMCDWNIVDFLFSPRGI